MNAAIDANSKTKKASPPFGMWERMLATRYLRSRREQGGVSLISIIAFAGIMLAVAVLIIVMSVMNGFRTDLLVRALGVNGHVFVDARQLTPRDVSRFIVNAKAVPDVKSVHPLVQGQVLAPVSYTHLDVYKRQGLDCAAFQCARQQAQSAVI